MTKKPVKMGHTASSPQGSGDYYGVGVKNPLGKIRDWSMGEVSLPPKNVKAKPKKLA
jgi:hypothetical protein